MKANLEKTMEHIFSSLSVDDKWAIISNGAALYLSSLKKHLFLAQSKIRVLEEKYNISLENLDREGLPDDADFQMHEDYLIWHHWDEKSQKLKKQIELINPIVNEGLHSIGVLDVGD